MLHLLACLTLEVGTMQIDQTLSTYPTDPIQQILDIAKVDKSEVGNLRWDVEERDDNQPIDCDKLKPAMGRVRTIQPYTFSEIRSYN